MIVNVSALSTGPLVRGTTDTSLSIRLWGRAKPKKRYDAVLIARIQPVGGIYSEFKELAVSPVTDYIEQIEFTDLQPATRYTYQMGYYYRALGGESQAYSWTNASAGSFVTDNPESRIDGSGQADTLWAFAFSSCRIHIGFGPVTLFGTGSGADTVYRAVAETDPEFWLEIGDQLYFDYVGPVYRLKKLASMRKLYQKVRSYPHLKHLHSNYITYEMCDDHDLHRDNTNASKKALDTTVWEQGLKCFNEYQYINGPAASTHLYYSFYRNNAAFFVCDTRSERTDEGIVSEEQLSHCLEWLSDPAHSHLIKFVVSPTPVISQTSVDSWFGYPVQQRKLVKAMLATTNAFILTGDAHCARTGVYQVYEDGIDTGQRITEILSSGLYSVTGDKGKAYDSNLDGEINIELYDKDNNFPFAPDNSAAGGLRLVTVQSTASYPPITTPYGIRLHAPIPFRKPIDSIFTKVNVDYNKLIVAVYNQNGTLLDSIDIALD